MKNNEDYHVLIRGLKNSRSDLRMLIYWMEHDRRLDAQPEKIDSLKKLLEDIENQLEKKSWRNLSSVLKNYQEH